MSLITNAFLDRIDMNDNRQEEAITYRATGVGGNQSAANSIEQCVTCVARKSRLRNIYKTPLLPASSLVPMAVFETAPCARPFARLQICLHALENDAASSSLEFKYRCSLLIAGCELQLFQADVNHS